jgi:phosphoglycerate dehydrogenase-like enzyme
MTPVESGRRKILVADAEYAETVSQIATQFENLEVVCPAEGQSAEELADDSFQALMAQTATVDEMLLDALPSIQAVLKIGRNYENVDVEAVRRRSLTFACAPRKGPNCVAELALTLTLALSKDLLISHDSVASGAYRWRGLQPEKTAQWEMAFHWMHNTRVHEVRGKTLGIVGMGEIGCELARRAQVMGMQNLYYKRTRLSDELERLFAASYHELSTLLQESDYLCLAVPHTSETEGMIGRQELEQMKQTAFLVNICRGGVVDEEALIAALSSERIAGAGLDVFTYEPLPAESPLCRLDNVILTPHIGGGTGTNRALELGEALTEMEHILSGGRPHVDLTQPPV